MTTRCSVCSLNPHKYKCPLCKSLTCSLPCYSSHKQNSCASTVTAEDTDAQDSHATLLQKQKSINPSLLPVFGDPNALPPLNTSHLSALHSSQRLHDLLSLRMRSLLAVIDQAPNDREKERLYDEAVVYCPEFREFVGVCCRTLGFEFGHQSDEAVSS